MLSDSFLATNLSLSKSCVLLCIPKQKLYLKAGTIALDDMLSGQRQVCAEQKKASFGRCSFDMDHIQSSFEGTIAQPLLIKPYSLVFRAFPSTQIRQVHWTIIELWSADSGIRSFISIIEACILAKLSPDRSQTFVARRRKSSLDGSVSVFFKFSLVKAH